jgi:hypothetical protein
MTPSPQPIKWPSVIINGIRYEAKFGPLAEYVADTLGLDLQQFFSGLRQRNVGTLSNMVKLWTAMVAHNFVSQQQPIPSPEYWAMIADQHPEKLKEMFAAVTEALQLKIQASAGIRLQEPAPIQEPQSSLQ